MKVCIIRSAISDLYRHRLIFQVVISVSYWNWKCIFGTALQTWKPPFFFFFRNWWQSFLWNVKCHNGCAAVLPCVAEVVDVLLRSSGTTTDTSVRPMIWTFIQLLTCWWLAAEMPQRGSVRRRFFKLWNRIYLFYIFILNPHDMFNLLTDIFENIGTVYSFSCVACFNARAAIGLLSRIWLLPWTQVWDIRTKANVHTLSGHTNTVATVRCQAAEPQVITGKQTHTVNNSMFSHVAV